MHVLANWHIHWTAGFRPVFISESTGPPPVMCIVRRKAETFRNVIVLAMNA
jgi:hypothetical protein